MDHEWRPGASVEQLRGRARRLARAREYFARHGVFEVTTPVLCRYATAEPALHTLALDPSDASPALYLRTSPESAMKRLLAAGSGDIYQIGPAFRGDEAGRLHLPEFTLLEWYRLDFDHHRLMDDVESFVRALGFDRPVSRMTYRTLWERHVGGDPHALSTGRLVDIAESGSLSPAVCEADDRAGLFDRIHAERLEPALGAEGAVFIYDFPVELRAYARLSADAQRVAERFELIIDGVEIANGYHEIGDADEQRACFEQDNALRARRGLPTVRPDAAWLDALAHGFPPCAGVALGIERLFMALDGTRDIACAASFAHDLRPA